jgi:hypothetical protein
MLRLSTQESDNDLFPSDLAKCVYEAACRSRGCHQQLGVRLRLRGWFRGKAGEERICENRDESLQMGIKELGVFLKRFELVSGISSVHGK